MSAFWVIVVGVGMVWVVNSGRAEAVLAALTSEPAAVTPGQSVQYTPPVSGGPVPPGPTPQPTPVPPQNIKV